MNVVAFKQQLQADSDVLNALAEAISEANYANHNDLAESLELLRSDFVVECELKYCELFNNASFDDFCELANI